MAGGISRVTIFGSGGARPDWKALKLIARLGSVRDDILLRGVAEELARSGFQVFGAAQVLDRAIAEKGLLSRRVPDRGEFRDALIGWEAAKGIGALDIGQTVVTFQGLVVAAEAIDGTDATIRRAGDLTKRKEKGLLPRVLFGALSSTSGLSSRGPVVVKVCKPQQDERMDLPTVGSNTIEAMREAGATALIVEAGRTLILDYDDVITQANAAGISVFAAAGLQDLGAAEFSSGVSGKGHIR
jgi:DUF1009 family protein